MKTQRTPISAPAPLVTEQFPGPDFDRMAILGIKNAIRSGLSRRAIAQCYAVLLGRLRSIHGCEFSAINYEIVTKFPKKNKLGRNLALQAIKKQAWKIYETKIKEK